MRVSVEPHTVRRTYVSSSEFELLERVRAVSALPIVRSRAGAAARVRAEREQQPERHEPSALIRHVIDLERRARATRPS